MAEPATRPTPEARIRAAIWFAGQGFGIFPCWSTRASGICRCPAGPECTSPGKHPLTQHGFEDATTDPARIATFLAAASQPNYGMVPPEGVFVWDVDTPDERTRLSELEQRHGALPPTLRDTTANGEHVFLRWPEGMPRPLKKMFGLVTRWGSGKHAGYVIGPRSVHASGAEYAPPADVTLDIAMLPEAWARAAIEGDTPTGSGHVYVGERLPEQGQRHDWLRDRARFFRGFMESPETLRAALFAENDRLPVPKSPAEVERAIGDVFSKFPADPVEHAEEVSERRLEGEPGVLGPPLVGVFPEPPDRVAFGGLVGECVELMAHGTDASLAGLLGSFLAICGAMVPARAYSRGEQTSSPFIALVGESAIGRKGTAMNRALDAAKLTWQADNVNRLVLDGLNSGEALVAALAKRRENDYDVGRPVTALVFEDEYASMLQSRAREGSTLDQKLRVAFDGGPLSNRKAADSRVVPPPYWLPALAAITPVELRRHMSGGDSQNGSANRWLYIPVVKRDIIAPDEPPVLDADIQESLVEARGKGNVHELTVDPAVGRRVSEYAEFVIVRSHGVARDLVKRSATIAFRIALVHAAIERSRTVTLEHLERALALTEYARRGIAWVFGQTIGDPEADLLLRHLQADEHLSHRYITQNIIRQPVRRQAAIDELVRLGYAYTVPIPTRGRPRLELVLDPSARTFEAFSAFERFSGVSGDDKSPASAQKSPSERGADINKGSGRVQEHLRNTSEPAESAVVDHATGEKVDRSDATWARQPCALFRDHQTSHRNTDAGWVCLVCDKDMTG